MSLEYGDNQVRLRRKKFIPVDLNEVWGWGSWVRGNKGETYGTLALLQWAEDRSRSGPACSRRNRVRIHIRGRTEKQTVGNASVVNLEWSPYPGEIDTSEPSLR
jgi:hypothetical protein